MPSTPNPTAGTLSRQRLELLVCPGCHSALRLDGDAIHCTGCDRKYPIVDNLPILLLERAL